MKRLLAVLALVVAAPAAADEGMWTFDNFPSEKVKQKYGFAPTQQWLDEVRLSSARIANGCSSSFVSEQGLVLTNHHCVHRCLAQLSTAESDLVEKGFYAEKLEDERQCPAFELNQLVSIEDVTSRINRATSGLSGQKLADALQAEKTKIEKGCADSTKVRCDVVTLYEGGQYHLYRYRRFQDVRLVWAPELDIGFFGGDPDNFNFPRYNLDAAFLRVWEDGKPAKMENFFRWSPKGAQPGQLAFVSGHPGSTSRLLPVSALRFERDVLLPNRLFYLAELRGLLGEFMTRGQEQERIAKTDLFGVENSFKALRGMREALIDEALFSQKVQEEEKLRAWVDADPKRKKKWGGAWDRMEKAQQARARLYDEYSYVEGGRPLGFSSQLFAFARALVRAADELPKKNEQRLREFNDANLPALRAQIASRAPIYPELEERKLAWSLGKLREVLGTDDPLVRKVLGNESPEQLAKRLVSGSQLGDPAVREKLLDGGKKAVAASKDPMIELARRIDPEARAIRKQWETEVVAPQTRAGEEIAAARFAAFGTEIYPDATFTLRLSFGAVEGYVESDGRKIEPITRLGGLFDRATGEDPYELPERWLKAKSRLDLNTPMNFVSTNDIIGGNSGSPVIDQDKQIIGLIFDGNIQSLGGDYGFDPAVNRAVSVHSAAILEALEVVYGAKRILEELQPKR